MRALLPIALALVAAPLAHAKKREESVDTRPAMAMALATAARRSGQWDMAAKLMREATVARPDDAAAWAGLGEALIETGRHEEGLAALGRAHGKPADATGLARHKGRALVALGRAPEAEAAYRAATAEAPRDPRAWTGLGVALDLQRRHGDAAAAYDRALALDPLSMAARNNRALSLALAGRRAEAAALLARLAATPEAPRRVRANLALLRAATAAPVAPAADDPDTIVVTAPRRVAAPEPARPSR